MAYVFRCFFAYLHIRVWRYPLKDAGSLDVLNIVLYIRSPSKKRGRSTWLNARTDRTTSLCLARINVSEPSPSIMDTDRMMRAVKKLLLTMSMQKSSNKLRYLQSFTD